MFRAKLCNDPFVRASNPYIWIQFLISGLLGITGATPLHARILWSDRDWHLLCNTNQVLPIPLSLLSGPSDLSKSTLFFRFTVDPISDFFTEPVSKYEAGLIFSDKGNLHLGIGNAWNAWGYSAFHAAEMGFGNTDEGEFDLNTELLEVSNHLSNFEPPRYGVQRTIVVRVQFIPGETDQITVWMEPDLSAGSNEQRMTQNQTTTFRADASFDQILLSHRGGGHGWRIGNLVIASQFRNLTDAYVWQKPLNIALSLAVVSTLIGSLGWFNSKRRELRLQRKSNVLIGEKNTLEEERKRIARDLHDDLGSTLSEISLLSSIALSSKDPSQELFKIESRALRSVEALEEIVWSIDPKADSVQNFVEHASRFAEDFLYTARIRLDLIKPSVVMAETLQAGVRHNLYLAFKESLNNVFKHAQADQVNIRFDLTPEHLSVRVSDNGQGNCPSLVNGNTGHSQSHGLRNMRSRLESVGGFVCIDSQPNLGTTVCFQVPVHSSQNPASTTDPKASFWPSRNKAVGQKVSAQQNIG
jgi:signal transduction histidine kinase